MSERSKSSQSFEAQLENACDDLWWSSESDYPVEVVWQSEIEINSESAAGVIEQWVSAQHPEDKIETVDLSDFFERAIAPKSWHTEEDKAQLLRLKELRDLLVAKLPALQVYRCGEVEIKVYVLGCADNKVLAGIQTTVVET